MHKTGSTSIQSMLLRYALRNKLNVALPKKGKILLSNRESGHALIFQSLGHMLGYPHAFHKSMVMENGSPNVFCLHAVWNHSAISTLMPEGTKYFSIVRDPVARFISFWHYFRMEEIQGRSLQEFAKVRFTVEEKTSRKFIY